MKKYFLLGYMGSGKSTLGPKLASKLSCPFLDFDRYIEEKEQKSITQIFQEHGEIYFRKMESIYLRELLESSTVQSNVIALGGGTPCYANNMQFLKDATQATTIYINTPYKVLAERLWKHREQRPLIATLKNYEDLEDYVRKHMFERAFYYNQADIVVPSQSASPLQIIDLIIQRL